MHVEAIGNCEELQLYALGILRYSGAKSQYLDDPGYRSHHSGKVHCAVECEPAKYAAVCAASLL
jgi:hypothetical protein